MNLPGLSFDLPDWVSAFLGDSGTIFSSTEARMRFVIELSRRNVEAGTGGPFGAGIFDSRGGLVAPGVNIVVANNCSLLHAEIVAIALAQKKLGRFDISAGGKLRYELVTSTEPCAMCFGAIPWSGVSGVICGARDEDARRIGFDEGPKLADWAAALGERGIRVEKDVLRGEAADVLEMYARTGGSIYNAGLEGESD